MVPFLNLSPGSVGDEQLDVFSYFVALAVICGSQIAIMRARRLDLDLRALIYLLTLMLCMGFVIAHLVAILFYDPYSLLLKPVIVFQFWNGLSSIGGIIGAFLAGWFLLHTRPQLFGKRPALYIEAISFGIPFGWVVGRFGCLLVHDHPGYVTNFFLGISLETSAAKLFISNAYFLQNQSTVDFNGYSGFHDLAFYEILFTSIVIIPMVVFRDGIKHLPQSSLVIVMLSYLPFRFLLDFLRLQDNRHFGLTVGQLLIVFSTFFVIMYRKNILEFTLT